MKQYNVLLHTPIGHRSGSMNVKIDGGRISGMLHVLKEAKPFQGKIDTSGHCSFKGNLVTLTRTIPYQAEGIITEKAIELSLEGENKCYRLTGVPT